MCTRRYMSLLLLASACVTPASSGSSFQVTLAGAPLDSAVTAAPTVITSRSVMLADRRRRALLRGGKVYGHDALASSDIRISQFLRRVPGSDVIDDGAGASQVALRPCFGHRDGPVVFVDGSRVNDAVGTLNSFMSADLEMVEVYQGVALLPPEVTGGCSAVFLWTRRTE